MIILYCGIVACMIFWSIIGAIKLYGQPHHRHAWGPWVGREVTKVYNPYDQPGKDLPVGKEQTFLRSCKTCGHPEVKVLDLSQ